MIQVQAFLKPYLQGVTGGFAGLWSLPLKEDFTLTAGASASTLTNGWSFSENAAYHPNFMPTAAEALTRFFRGIILITE